MRYLLIFFLFFSTPEPAGNLDRIRRALDRKEYEKAYELLQKAKAKDQLNPGVDYLSAVLYSTESWRAFELDTARILVNNAIKNFETVDEKTRVNLEDDGITKNVVEELGVEIRDRIYSNVLSGISIGEAEGFMRRYPDSPYQEILIFKRDSIVFDQVRKNDSQGVYEEFLQKYSTPEFRKIAVKRIDELRYQVLVHSGSLPDYYQFLENHPQTNFRDEIEAYIYRVSLADHSMKSYLDFLQFAKNESLLKRAGDLLYYVSQKNGSSFRHPQEDSLTKVKRIADLELITTMERGDFGFHSTQGSLQIPYKFKNVEEEYKCTLTSDEWLFVSGENSGSIISKNGNVLISGVEAYTDLGSGAALVEMDGRTFLYHKSGFKMIHEPIEDAGVLNGRWLKVKKDGRWALIAFSGYQISKYRFNEITLEGSFWVFEKDGLLAVYNEHLIEERLLTGLDPEFKFDDFELVSDSVLIGFRDERECMLNNELKFLIPWGVYEINPDESGWYLKTPNGYRLYDHSENDIMNQVHPYLETNSGWLALKTNEDWMLLSRTRDVQPSRGYDSLKLINAFCAYTAQEKKESLIFSNGNTISIDSTQKVKTFYNQSQYLLIENEEEKSIVDPDGQVLIKGTFDEVSFLNDTLLKTGIEGKHGLLNINGEVLVDNDFDVIDENSGLVLCLKEGKIGCVDLSNGSIIPPVSESRIEKVGNHYLIKKEGKSGLLDSVETVVLDYLFDEIHYWNDTSYLVKNETEWSFLNERGDQIEEPVEFLSEIIRSEDESIWKFVKDGKYGLLSSENGILLSPEFTDIFNIGSDENPVFFADQHLDRAGYHVVSYVDRLGKLILSRAYTREEFDKILCED